MWKRSESQYSLQDVEKKQIIVIKIGSSSLVNNHMLNLPTIARLCQTAADLQSQGFNVVIVSSGAIGVGCQVLGLEKRPTIIQDKQAIAAIGQVHLMRYYEDFLKQYKTTCAQVMLTLDNICQSQSAKNARNTFKALFGLGAVPVVNENDTVAVEELRFEENDSLAAQVAILLHAQWLFLLTDVECLYSANPFNDPTAQKIHEVHDVLSLSANTQTHNSKWGKGGMGSKVKAATLACAAGCATVICIANQPENMQVIIDGDRSTGTYFYPKNNVKADRKRWLLFVPVKGQLWLDDGAIDAITIKHKSLFAAGIKKVVGHFSSEESVSICNLEGVEIARGLCNYCDEEVVKLKGLHSNDYDKVLGYSGRSEIVHRKNVAILLESELQEDEALVPNGVAKVQNGGSQIQNGIAHIQNGVALLQN